MVWLMTCKAQWFVKLLIAVNVVILAGCASTRQMTLFANQQGEYTLPAAPEVTLAPGDALAIRFAATDEAAVAPYRAAGDTLVIASDGTITLPVLGTITVAGLSEQQLQQRLTDSVALQVRKPVVNVRVIDAYVSVMGEVNLPQRVAFLNPLTLLDAIAAAGGLTDNARRDNVLLQRRTNGQVQLYRVNLLNNDLFASPCYFLQKGDVVYISPLHSK